MTWSPARLPLDAAMRADLEPYLDRAAEMWRADDFAGRLFVEADWSWDVEAGVLWWRRWSQPYEVVRGYVRWTDGSFDSFVTDRASLDQTVRELSHDVLRLAGVTYRLEWRTPAESESLRRELGLRNDRGLSLQARRARAERVRSRSS